MSDSNLSANQRAFLAAYSATGNITQAARAADIGRSRHYAWAKESPEYAAAFEAAHAEACDSLEAEARRRAVEGTEDPVFYKGEKVGVVRRYSDLLLIALLRANLPEKYVDRQRMDVNANVQQTPGPQIVLIAPGASRPDESILPPASARLIIPDNGRGNRPPDVTLVVPPRPGPDDDDDDSPPPPSMNGNGNGQHR